LDNPLIDAGAEEYGPEDHSSGAALSALAASDAGRERGRA